VPQNRWFRAGAVATTWFRAGAVATTACGIAFAATVAVEVLPATGPLRATTMQRLLIVDAERLGNRIVAVGDRGYIVFSDDGGTSWKRARTPPAPLLTSIDFLDAQSGLAVGHDAMILRTADAGETWTQQFSAPAEQRPLLDVNYLTSQRAIAVGAYAAYYETTDGGKSWNARKIGTEDKHFNAILELGDGRLLILGEAGTILGSDDNGATWSPVASPYKGSLFGGVIANDGAVVAFGMRGRIYRSSDKGRTWKQIDNPSVATLMGGEKMADGTLVIAGAAGTALVSRDNGQSFQPLETGSTKTYAKALLGAANTLLLLGEAGVRTAPLPQQPKR
jgi:photosystem II stability/assembly factor-like uncharacterized protein